MEATYIVDCGHHTTKYAGLSKRNKRTVEVLIKEQRSDCALDMPTEDRLRQNIPQMLSGDLRTDEELTLMLLLDTFASQRAKASLLHACFEQFSCKKVCLHYTACTGLYAAGETSGVVADVGHASVQLSAVYKGVIQPALSAQLNSVGTRQLDERLRHLLHGGITEEALHLIKSQCCTLTDTEELVPELTLPDGTTFSLESVQRQDVRQATRALLFSTVSSVPDTLRSVYQKHTLHFRDAAASSWLRLGGGAQVSGVAEALSAAMAHPLLRHTPKELDVKDATRAPVSGGIILSQLNVFKSMCISAPDYDEYGPEGCVHMQVVDSR